MAVLSINRHPSVTDRLLRLMRDGRAVTAVEYGIVAAFLCLVLLGIFTSFGSVLTTMFNRASTGI